MEGRLQFIHRNKVFTTSEDAKSYVDSLVKRNYISLLAEPMVLLYGDKTNPNILLVIGNKTNDKEPGTLDFFNGNGYFYIDSAKMEADILSNKDAIEKLDLEIDEIQKTIREIKNELTRIQEELDNTQLGAGLAEDGSYVPNVSFSNRPIAYITEAESLNDADVKLDIALQVLDKEVVKEVVVNGVKGEVKDNVARVTIDTSDINVDSNFANIVPDLKEDGHLHIHSGDTISMVFAKIEKTYDTEKTKREETDKKLDAEIKRSVEKDEIFEKGLADEIIRATEIEKGLRVDVDNANEKIDTFLLAADLTQDAIDTLREIQNYIDEHGEEAAKMVDDIAKNTKAIADEVARSTEKDAVLEQALEDEVNRATDAELALKNEFSNTTNKIESEYKAADAAIITAYEKADAAIITAYEKADKDLDTAYKAADAAIITAYEKADKDLDTAYKAADAAIITAYEKADAAIITAYEKADKDLDTAYKTADAAINTRIDNVEHSLSDEVNRAKSVEESLLEKIILEKDRAELAESGLLSTIESEKERAEKKEDELNQAIVNEKDRAERVENGLRDDVNRIDSNVISLQERMNGSEGDILDLVTRMSAAENNIEANKDNLTAETNSRISADTELQSKIDILFTNKVEVEDGKGLTSNDFTDVLLNKLNSIEENAQNNKIEKVFVDNILLDITDNKEVKINMPKVPVQGVYVDDNILSLNGTELSANVSLAYDKTTQQFILYGKDTTKVISTIDVSEFIKDGMLDKVEVITLDNGKTVIRITWNTESGHEITDVPADSLIQVYEAGEGIIKINDTFSIRLNTNVSENFLRVDSNGLYTEGIKQFVAESIVISEEKTNERLVNLSDAIVGTQKELSDLSGTVEGLKDTCNIINTDLAVASNDIDVLKNDINTLKEKDNEIEKLAKNSFTPVDGDGISLVLTPGSESDRTNILSGKIKGYYTYAAKPEAEKDSDYSLLRLTDDGHIFVTNSTSAMKHMDIDGNPHVLSTFINSLKLDNDTLRNELNIVKDELAVAKNKITELENTLNGLISGENSEFMSMLKRAIINSDTFKDEETDPTVEVVVTEGENVVIRTREDAVYEGSVIS